ncbi:3-oxoacyl-[acyl-carrier-protein] reductase FabG-like [Rhipicephalus sanguineus]|uniref:3-oxoacyl-[acyl-carrier-protein] reductase FabG-like n=1 Tax=Rhipicephalus sanguineus TaxID=34632 RepID=UPI001893A47B|nr:3-oxoacyl-[acyl-carrier-protein] reductase FabG-like [Rhipicephalus sanguineus]
MEDFDKAWKTNFRGPLCLMKNAIPYLRQTKGNVVNISSVSAVAANQCNIPYSVVKAALEHLTRCAALENAPHGVRVNTVSPGSIKTFMARLPGVSDEEFMESLEKIASSKHALGRIGTPEEVAHSIAFLASDDAEFVTGITMPVEGGLLLLSSISDVPKILDAQKTA